MESSTGLPTLDVVVILGVAGFIAWLLRMWVKSILDKIDSMEDTLVDQGQLIAALKAREQSDYERFKSIDQRLDNQQTKLGEICSTLGRVEGMLGTILKNKGGG